MGARGPKSRIDEELYRPETTDEARELARDLIDAGVSRSQAWSIVGWLIDPEGVPWAEADPDYAAIRRRQLKAIMAKLPIVPPPGLTYAKARIAIRDMGAYLDSLDDEPVDELALAS
ncbi:MAG: hypothetical protein FWC87_01185 [Acidimicrobiaceae bacterium]|nr:hypothetical protein [Acidimicrobiaceae bacterium]